MDGMFGALIWLIIIFMWIFSASKKTKRKDYESREKTPPEFEKKKQPTPALAEDQISLFEAPKLVVAKVIDEQAETMFSDLLTEEKLREGIVLSIILGPPKAYQFLDFSKNRDRHYFLSY